MIQRKIKELIVDKISGEWGKLPVDNNGINVIRTANFLNDGTINFSDIVVRNILENKINKKQLINDDIIIEKSGGSPRQPVGRVVYFQNPDDEKYLCNNFTTILRADRSKIYPKYLFYALFYNYKIGKTLRYQNKTTGIINLKLDYYLNSKIPLPENYDDQIRIAIILSRVEKMIARRKESIRLLDEFLESTFIEMFGGSENKKGWSVKKLGIISKVQGGLQVTPKRRINPIEMPYLRVANVYRDKLQLDQIKMIRVTEAELKRVLLKKGDILIVEGHGNPKEIGRSAVWNGAIEKCLHQNHLIRVRVDKEKILPIFCSAYINSSSGKRQMFKAGKTTSGLNTISSKNVKNTQIRLPPITLQNQFATIVEKVEIIKAKYQASLEELENLYGSLSQKAFKGELDLSRVPVNKTIHLSGSMEAVMPGFSGKITVKKDIRYSQKALTELIQSTFKTSFDFDDLMEVVEKTSFKPEPEYKDIKNVVFKLLKGRKPLLSQTFDIDKKQMALAVNP
jgi:type I restriction enzyme, S subunit